MLKPGDTAPAFTLEDAQGEAVSLDDLLTHGPLILYFYPADFTPGCTKEACAIRDIHDDIINSGLRVVGVSPQDCGSHERFAERYDLPFPLLCDPKKKTTKAFKLDGPLGIGSRRGTYLIDTDSSIVDAVLADVTISRHVDFIQRAIAAQQPS
ncbi:MAG: peroxiredoxin [Pseudomonadota bacterium]